MTRTFAVLFAVLVSFRPAGAVSSGTWRQSGSADYERATLTRISLRSDGRLSLAPVFRELLDSSSPYLWALAEDSRGNVYAGGGGPGASRARVYVISPDGKSRVLAEFDALEVHALAMDRDDRLYAATSPDAKVYRIGAGGKTELFYDPAAKYVWAMVFDAKGGLCIATGDQGLIHRVTPDGKGAVLYRTEEHHARSLALDGEGNLIVGTEPDGLVVRVSPAGQGFVLFETPKREVTAVAVAPDGVIYAAGVGAKQPATAPPAPGVAPPTPLAPPGAAGAAQTAPPQTAPAAQPPPTLAPAQALLAGGSEVYRIETDGYARRVWANPQDVVYSLAVDGQGRLLIGTGNRGNIYRLDSDVLSTLLVKSAPTQVTGLYAGRQGRVLAATGNLGKVLSLGPGLEKEGSVESEVFDAGLFSYWGRLSYTGAPGGGAVRFETRSGNLDRPRQDWSPWTAVQLGSDGGRISSPQARFLQWRLTLTASASGASPEVDAVDAAYLPKNVPPVIQEIEITAANYRFPAQSLTITPSRTLTLQPLGRPLRPAGAPMADSGVVTLQYEKGQIGARWNASDENGDDLLFKAEIRGRQETVWRLLKDKIKERYVSWDSTAFPDGEYLLRITATDLPDNPPGQELSAQLVSRPFLIDNSPPGITGLTASRAGGKLEVRWTAADAQSLLQKAEYSLDGGEWLVAEPTTRVSDSREHDYVLVLDGVSTGEHTVAVRVTDDYDNQAVAKAVVK
ncbi:MAG: hypothetical protein IT159_08145 [Bryobacterales bacterium]|nr:hypothetical protein [Bryobacterales bacterium]